jgi:hypothetical protein
MKNEIRWKWDSSVRKDLDININDYLVPAYNAPNCPFKKIKTYVSGARTILENFALKHKRIFDIGHIPQQEEPNYAPSIKVCPGVSPIVMNSLLVKSPSDFIISIDSNGRFLPELPSVIEAGMDFIIHPFEQTRMDNGDNLLDGRVMVKLAFPLFINVDNECVTLNPSWEHTQFPWKVSSGIIPAGYTGLLNIFIDLDIPETGTNQYYVKKGDPLAYLYFPNKKLGKLREVPDLSRPTRRKFLRGVYS